MASAKERTLVFVNLLNHWHRRKANQDADPGPPGAKQLQPLSREDGKENRLPRKESPDQDR